MTSLTLRRVRVLGDERIRTLALGLLDEADRVYDGDYSPNVAPVAAVRARLRLRRGCVRASGLCGYI